VDVTYAGSYLLGLEDKDTRYDQASGKLHADAILSLATPDAKVLDIGCGFGRVEKFLAPHVREVHGVDVSGVAVRRARQFVRAENCHFHRISGKDLHIFPDRTFDLVFSISTIQHMSKEQAFVMIAEAYRVLKEGGRLLVDFPDLASQIKQFALNALVGISGSTRMRYYTKEEVKLIFDFCGFSDMRFLPAGFLHEGAIHALGTR